MSWCYQTLCFDRMETTTTPALIITEDVDDLLRTSESEMNVSQRSVSTIRAEERKRRRELRARRIRHLQSSESRLRRELKLMTERVGRRDDEIRSLRRSLDDQRAKRRAAEAKLTTHHSQWQCGKELEEMRVERERMSEELAGLKKLTATVRKTPAKITLPTRPVQAMTSSVAQTRGVSTPQHTDEARRLAVNVALHSVLTTTASTSSPGPFSPIRAPDQAPPSIPRALRSPSPQPTYAIEPPSRTPASTRLGPRPAARGAPDFGEPVTSINVRNQLHYWMEAVDRTLRRPNARRPFYRPVHPHLPHPQEMWENLMDYLQNGIGEYFGTDQSGQAISLSVGPPM